MAKYLNEARLLGNLGSDPEFRSTPSGTQVVRISLATQHPVKRNNKWEDATEWHTVLFWAKQAERVKQLFDKGLFVKGSRLLIDGAIRKRSWLDRQTNATRSDKEIHVRDFTWLSAPRSAQDKEDAIAYDEPGVGYDEMPLEEAPFQEAPSY